MKWQDYQNEPTEDLIEYMTWKDQSDYTELAESAFIVITFRFQKQVVSKCRIICKNWGYTKEEADLIAEKTFERFKKYPYTFDKSKCKKKIDDCVVLYLFRIAQNILANTYRADEEPSPYSGNEEIVRELELDLKRFTSEKRKELKRIQEIVEKALNSLSPKHKTIFLTYKTYEHDGYKLPRELLKSLREDLDLTQSSIRVYKKEAFDKVEEYLKIYGGK
jgi:DNA-directed RNA polymerase specialized sigma24 family protein